MIKKTKEHTEEEKNYEQSLLLLLPLFLTKMSRTVTSKVMFPNHSSIVFLLPPPSSLLPFFSPHLLLLSSTKMEWAPLYEKRYRSYSTEKGLYTIYHSILFYFMSISLLCDYRNHFYIGVFVCIETWIWPSWVKYFALASPVTGWENQFGRINTI